MNWDKKKTIKNACVGLAKRQKIKKIRTESGGYWSIVVNW